MGKSQAVSIPSLRQEDVSMTNQGIVDTIDLCLRRRKIPAEIREFIP